MKELFSLEIPEILNNLGVKNSLSEVTVIHSNQLKKIESEEGRPFRSDHFSIIIILKGTLGLRVNLFDYRMKENDVIIITPTSIRQFAFAEDVEYYAILFKTDYLFRSGLFQKHFKLVPLFNDDIHAYMNLRSSEIQTIAKIADLLKGKIVQENKTDSDLTIIDLFFQSLILQLISYSESIDDMDNSINKNDLIYRFLTLLPKHFRQEREVNFYADQLFVNAKYLTQVLTSKTNKSARDYIVEIVTLEAKVLLDNPKNTVKDVAESLNFSDQFHFSHFFKKSTGKTPTQYRKGI